MSLLFNVEVSTNLLLCFLSTVIVEIYFVIVNIESTTMMSSLNVDVSANLLLVFLTMIIIKTYFIIVNIESPLCCRLCFRR